MKQIGYRFFSPLLVLSLSLLMLAPAPVYAAEGTEGTEMQVLEAEQLEVQLGVEWAGVEFQLKTDVGLYPDTIAVGEDGVLRLEIGGSSEYILSCLNSTVAVPDPDDAADPDTDESQGTAVQDGENVPADEAGAEADNAEEPVAEPESGTTVESTAGTDTESGAEDGANQTEVKTVAGIPVLHLALFGGGMVLAVGTLIGMSVMKKRRKGYSDDGCEENEDDE